MRPAVIYSEELEPITVVDLPEQSWQRLAAGDRLRLRYTKPLSFSSAAALSALSTIESHDFHIYGELIQRRGHRTLWVFTDNELLMLATRSSLLPGQRADAQRRERAAYIRGVISGLADMGD